MAERAHGVWFVQETSAGTGGACGRAAGGKVRGRCRGWRRFGRRFRQADPRTARTGTRRNDPSARARGQFGRRRRRGDRNDTLHHSPAYRRAHRAQQRRARHRDHVLAGRRQVHPFGGRHRVAGPQRRASSPIRPLPPPRKPVSMSIGSRSPRPRSAMSST